MANVFYTPEQVARVAVALASEDAFLAGLISRNLENDLLGGGGKGRSVNIKVPSVLIAHDRSIDDKTTAIVFDELAESTVAVTLGSHAYSAVKLSEGDLNLDLSSFSEQVLAPQVASVVDMIEDTVATALTGLTEDNSIAYSAADPVATFTAIRKTLRTNGVPQTGINCVVGVDVYADLLEAKAITDASQAGSTAALRDAGVGRVRGFNIVESTRVPAGDIIAFHREAFTLAVRAPAVPQGASFGSSVSSNGFSLRYLRDYDVNTVADRSLVSTFYGVAAMPLYKVTRDYTGGTASITAVTGGAALRVDTTTAAV